jgi:hypothetical protein
MGLPALIIGLSRVTSAVVRDSESLVAITTNRHALAILIENDFHLTGTDRTRAIREEIRRW